MIWNAISYLTQSAEASCRAARSRSPPLPELCRPRHPVRDPHAYVRRRLSAPEKVSSLRVRFADRAWRRQCEIDQLKSKCTNMSRKEVRVSLAEKRPVREAEVCQLRVPKCDVEPVRCIYPSAGCRGCAREEPSSVDTRRLLSRAAI